MNKISHNHEKLYFTVVAREGSKYCSFFEKIQIEAKIRLTLK